MNDKMQEVSKALLGLHVKDVFKKKDGLKTRELTEDDKQKIKDLFTSLEKQVNDFVEKTKNKGTVAEEKLEEKAKKTRTTLRDKLRNKK